jgi:hypothetical protein
MGITAKFRNVRRALGKSVATFADARGTLISISVSIDEIAQPDYFAAAPWTRQRGNHLQGRSSPHDVCHHYVLNAAVREFADLAHPHFGMHCSRRCVVASEWSSRLQVTKVAIP